MRQTLKRLLTFFVRVACFGDGPLLYLVHLVVVNPENIVPRGIPEALSFTVGSVQK